MSRTLVFAYCTLLAAALVALAVVYAGRGGAAEGDPVAEAVEQIVEDDPLTPAQAALDTALSQLGGGFEGHAGIAVRSLDEQDERTIHFNGLEPFPQQSVSKMWVALTALEAVDDGDLDLDEMAQVRFEDLTVFHQPVRNIVLARGSFSTSWSDLLSRAIRTSDNTANDMLLRRVGGPQEVQAVLDDKKLGSIRFGTDERTKQSAIAGVSWEQRLAVGPAFYDRRDQVPDDVRRHAFEAYLADPMDGAAPVAVADALARLGRGELLSQESTARLLADMAAVKSGPNRLKGGLPPGWAIAHKTGTGQYFDGEQSGYNDIGILAAPDGRRYAVVIMIARTRRPVPELMDFMHRVVAAVADYHAASGGELVSETGRR